MVAVLEIGRDSMFSSRVLGLIGLTISFLGTLGMLWGGLDSFIMVKPKDTMSGSEVSILYNQDDYTHRSPNYELVLTDIAGINRHNLINKIGKILLAVGFALQFVALWIDP